MVTRRQGDERGKIRIVNRGNGDCVRPEKRSRLCGIVPAVADEMDGPARTAADVRRGTSGPSNTLTEP